MPAKQFPTQLAHTLKTHHGKSEPATPLNHSTPLTSIRGPVNTVTFSSITGSYVLTGSSDRTIHLSRAIPDNARAETVTTTPIQKYEAHGYSVLDVAVTADNAQFASVGGDRQVFLWDVEQGATVRRWGGHGARVEAVQFAGEGDSVVVSGGFIPFLARCMGGYIRYHPTLDYVGIVLIKCSYRQRGHNHQPLGHTVQRTQTNPNTQRRRRHRLLTTHTHGVILHRQRQLRRTCAHLRCSHRPCDRRCPRPTHYQCAVLR